MSREEAMLMAMLGMSNRDNEVTLAKQNFESETAALEHAKRVANLKPGDEFCIKRETENSVEVIKCVARNAGNKGRIGIYRWHPEGKEIAGGAIAPSSIFFND